MESSPQALVDGRIVRIRRWISKGEEVNGLSNGAGLVEFDLALLFLRWRDDKIRQ
jgi:hypothetical protein